MPGPFTGAQNLAVGDDTAHGGKLPISANDEYHNPSKNPDSMHILAQDSGWEAGFHLATAVDNAFILGYALLVMAFLGWIGGTILFILGGACALYCNVRLAHLTVIDGQRFVRFRDISYHVFGTWAKWLTVVCQWINIVGGNIGLQILGGQALKGIHDLFTDNQNIKLSEWIIITGVFNGLFSLLIPALHQLRLWSAIACGCTIIFFFIVIGIASHDGTTCKNQNSSAGSTYPRTYAVFGDTPTQIFDAMGALATITFAYTTVIGVEIQATVRPGKRGPAREFYKALTCTYCIGAPVFLIMSLLCWWAYGDFIDANVIFNLSGPKWAIVIAQIAVFIQVVVSFQVYCAPIYETVDTIMRRPGENLWSPRQIIIRICYRVPYICFSTFVAALLPFFGDFVALLGSITVIPLAFVLTLAMNVKVNGHKMNPLLKWFEICLAILFAFICAGSTIAAIRYIVVDSINYHVFANLSG